MGLVIIIYISFFIFLAGMFSLISCQGIIRAAIGLQLLIFSAMFNFLGFSYHLYIGSMWDKSFLIMALVVLYLLLFCIFFYAYSILKNNHLVLLDQLNFFEWDRSMWWGEDHS